MHEEENFPRGGKIVRKRPADKARPLFGGLKPAKIKKTKKKPKSRESNATIADETNLEIKNSLSYNSIQNGMVILGCIRRVANVSFEVELPGLCFASVKLTEISDPFTQKFSQQLEQNSKEVNTLSKFFSVGQYLPVKITQTEKAEKGGKHLEASINPKDIYSEVDFRVFKKNMLVWGCISSESDHGYEISLGVKNCRAFWPTKSDTAFIGQCMWLVVVKSEISESASIITLKTPTKNIKPSVENLHCLIPGTNVNFVTTKITPRGIQGQFSTNNYVGYLDENYLKTPLDMPTKYHEGISLVAYVLYVEPMTKVTHLTLRPLENETDFELNVGDVVKGQVLPQNTSHGITFKLPNNLRGFIVNKRLMKTLKQSENIAQALKKKYSVGSIHQCRILDYNRLMKTYICTTEADVVQNPTFNANDLKVGQLMEGKILQIKEEGVVVGAGHVRGFCWNSHLSNVAYSENIKKKFKEGDKVKVRVWHVKEDEKVLFTMKPGLIDMEDANFLTSLEDVDFKLKYRGMVWKTTSLGCQISFYNGIQGWLSRSSMGKQAVDPSKYFYSGQIVNVYAKRVTDTNLYLSLTPLDGRKNVGGRFNSTVKNIEIQGLRIQLENSKEIGFVPNAHLTQYCGLSEPFKRTLTVGDKLVNLMYVGGSKPEIFSLREGKAVLRRVPEFSKLKQDEVIRCSFIRKENSGIYVQPLLQNYPDPIFVKIDCPVGLVEHQLLKAKVLNVSWKTEKSLKLSLKLEDVTEHNVENCLDYFTGYLNELCRIHLRARKQKWPICQYKPGMRVQCQVEKIGQYGGCVVNLSNGAKGIAVPALCPESLKIGENIEGTIIAHDFNVQYVDVCLKRNISSKINKEQKGILSEPLASAWAQKILVKDDFVVAVLRHPKGNKQLIYLPKRVHHNDFEGCAKFYETRKKFKVSVCGKVKRFLIGLSTRQFLKLDSATKTLKVTKKEESDSGIEEVEIEEKPIFKREEPVLPGISSFFNRKRAEVPNESSSEDEQEPLKQKKKKLTPAEKASLIKEEEERIRKIENELADENHIPETAEQFDRLLMAKPDCAELWAKYIAFHVAATEVDKARVIVQRALETINMTLTEEKFKIWVIRLNLENLFGTKETFDNCFEESLKFNDPLQIYLKVIEMLAENGKLLEMEEKIAKARTKFKQNMDMWLEIAKTYYRLGKFQDARDCKVRALRSIKDLKSQMMIIVRFAIMEFKMGEPEQGSAIFEAILTTNPKKVNIWTTYVDQLVKNGEIEEARSVLQRAVAHKLPLKSMKTLFLKFRKFEEVHGNQESIEEVKQLALEYAQDF
ncbi:hypothetical protein ABEB36_011571 [Hypothenemus hampei]|uniref:S1 motif domain-containing protein n=1 Tax=Hypothenemus hampei TaxID=57062 RepID=A0ABD1EB10_HYPHA